MTTSRVSCTLAGQRVPRRAWSSHIVTSSRPVRSHTACASSLLTSLAVGGVYDLFGSELRKTDYYLAFLPLAHILELVVELALSFYGTTTGYGRIKTLTDASVRNCFGDIREFKPTIMVAVPAVWEAIRKGIVGKVNKSGTLRKSMFNGALSIKRANVPVLKGVVDSVVFSQVRAQTGGRLRLALSGGSALSAETQEFLSLALVSVIQGL